MFKSSIEKLSDDQLRKRGRLFLGISIGMLAAMCFVLGMALYQISNGSDGTMTALSVPIIMGPFDFFATFGLKHPIKGGHEKKRTKSELIRRCQVQFNRIQRFRFSFQTH